MAYTYEQLKQMGATPGGPSSGTDSTLPKKKYTYDELINFGATPVQQTSTETPEKKSVGGFASNVLSSGTDAAKGIANMVIHPIETAKGIGKMGAGGVLKLIPGEQKYEENFDALTDFFKNRYGNKQAIIDTAYEDPVGFALDLSTVLTGGGAGVTKLGNVSKIEKLSKAGSAISKASDVVNPMTQATKLVGKGVQTATAGRTIGGKKYTTENLAATDNIGIERGDLPIFATTKSPISTTAEAVASKGFGGAKIWERMENVYRKMDDKINTLVSEKLNPTVIGRNIANAVDDFKTSFFEEKNKLYKEAIIPKPKKIDEIPGYENVKKVTLGAEDSLFANWNKKVLADGRIQYTKPTTPLFSGKQAPMPAVTVETQKILKSLIENEKQALKGYGAKSSSELKTYEGLLKGLSDKNLTTSDVYRTLQKLEGDIKYGTTLKTGNNARLSLIRETLDKEFLATLKQQRPDLAVALQKAEDFYQQGVKKINSAIIQSIVKNIKDGKLDIIVDDLIPKLESIEDVKLLVEVLGPENMGSLRTSILDNIFTEAKGVAGGNLQPLGISKQIKKFGEDKLEVLLSPDQLQAVKDLEQISKMMGRSSKITGGSQTSFNILSTAGGTAIFTAGAFLISGNFTGALVVLSPLFGNIAAAKFISSPLGRKLLTEGVKLTGKTGAKIQSTTAPAVGAAAQIGNQLSNFYNSQN